MRIKCENFIICGNHKCVYNENGECVKVAIALDASGKCVLESSKNTSAAYTNSSKNF